MIDGFDDGEGGLGHGVRVGGDVCKINEIQRKLTNY